MKTQLWICKIKLRVAVHPLNIKIHCSAHSNRRKKMQFRRVSRYIVMVTSRVHRDLLMFTFFFPGENGRDNCIVTLQQELRNKQKHEKSR